MKKVKNMTCAHKSVAKDEDGKISCGRCKSLSFRFGMKTCNVFKYVCLATIIIVASCFVTGCQKEEDYIVDEYYNNEYLSLPSNFDVSNLSDEHLKTIQLAFARMPIFSEDGIYKTNITSGSQINISENLFVFFNKTIDNSNNRAKEIKPLIPRLKDGANESTSSNDCVAYAVYKVLSYFGSTKSLSSIISYMRNTYGNNGVYSGLFYTAVRHYLIGDSITINSNYSVPAGSNVIVVFNEHAVNLVSCSDSLFMYYDGSPGAPSSWAFDTISKITHAFKATGKK